MNGLAYEVKRAKTGSGEISLNMTVLFVLEGSMTVRYQDDDIRMKRDDILLIGEGMAYDISGVRDALYGKASYSHAVLSDVMNGRHLYLYADSLRDPMHSYQDLRQILYELTADYISSDSVTSAGRDALLLRLLDCLTRNYQASPDALPSGDGEDPSRMQEIMQYIIQHINDEINLTELADQMYVSTSTLSRLFKKNTGYYFSDYVNRLRIESALGPLRHSDQSLTQIALGCGFSSSNTFLRVFKKVTGMNPSDYREKARAEEAAARQKRQEEEAGIREQLKQKGYLSGKHEQKQEVCINAAPENRRPFQNVWGQVINISSMYDMTRANTQYHVLYLQDQLHFSYVRIWNIFSSKMMVSDGQTIGQYNFDMIDQILDFLVQHHLKAFLDLGRRPDMAMRNDKSSVYHAEEYISFRSRESWEDIIDAFLSHIVSRYGLEEVSSWIFELSRDPDHYPKEKPLYEDPHYQFFDAWRYVYQKVRERIPGSMVGGISSLVSYDRAFIREFIVRCKEENCMGDFLSFSMFPYEFIDRTDGKEEPEQLFQNKPATPDVHFELDEIRKIRSMMEACGIGDRKLFITEWNPFISNRNYLNDGCFRSAYLVQKTEELWGETDLLAIMAGSDWVSSYMDTTGIVNGGIGLLTKNTIRKPAFYAIQFLNQMGKHLLDRGEHFIATAQNNGDLFLLCFYFSWFRRTTSLREGDLSSGGQDSSRALEDEQPLTLHIRIRNCPRTGKVSVKRRVLNENSGSILDEWGKFQYEKNLTPQDVKYLQEITTPRILLEKNIVRPDHCLELDLTLQPEEVSLVHIYPV